MADGGNRRTVAIIILLYILIAFGIICRADILIANVSCWMYLII